MNNNHIAHLESRVDHLETELSYINKILIQCGFTEGLEDLKKSALELLSEKQLQG